MILPSTYTATLYVILLGMLCWGSWAISFKMTRNRRFELFYFDFSLGALIGALIAAFTTGSLGFDGFSFLDDLRRAGFRQDFWAIVAGSIFNLGNMLLVAAVSVAGMAVAFPISIGLGMVIGLVWNYFSDPAGNRGLLFGGTAIILGAIIANALAYRTYAFQRSRQAAREGRSRQVRRSMSTKGIILSLAAGVPMGLFLPVLKNAMGGEIGLGPYSCAFVVALGIFFSTFVFNLVFMNLPVEGSPIEMADYFKGGLKGHALGIAGGAIWAAGLVSTLVAGSIEGSAKIGPTLSYGIGQAAPILAALWGLLVWNEFAGAGSKAKTLVAAMLLLFAGGLTLVSISLSS